MDPDRRWTEKEQVRQPAMDLAGSAGPGVSNTQIYEGTNQIQRVVIAKRLLG
jgi:alkylation response protein AidB-like acyl-CoA dehydrogenase